MCELPSQNLSSKELHTCRYNSCTAGSSYNRHIPHNRTRSVHLSSTRRMWDSIDWAATWCLRCWAYLTMRSPRSWMPCLRGSWRHLHFWWMSNSRSTRMGQTVRRAMTSLMACCACLKAKNIVVIETSTQALPPFLLFSSICVTNLRQLKCAFKNELKVQVFASHTLATTISRLLNRSCFATSTYFHDKTFSKIWLSEKFDNRHSFFPL